MAPWLVGKRSTTELYSQSQTYCFLLFMLSCRLLARQERKTHQPEDAWGQAGSVSFCACPRYGCQCVPRKVPLSPYIAHKLKLYRHSHPLPT